jgi:hypothetical protein
MLFSVLKVEDWELVGIFRCDLLLEWLIGCISVEVFWDLKSELRDCDVQSWNRLKKE